MSGLFGARNLRKGRGKLWPDLSKLGEASDDPLFEQ
jgi:hypothetical protein